MTAAPLLEQSQCWPIGQRVPTDVQRTFHEIDAGSFDRTEKSGTGVHSSSHREPQNGHGLSVALRYATASGDGSVTAAIFRSG